MRRVGQPNLCYWARLYQYIQKRNAKAEARTDPIICVRSPRSSTVQPPHSTFCFPVCHSAHHHQLRQAIPKIGLNFNRDAERTNRGRLLQPPEQELPDMLASRIGRRIPSGSQMDVWIKLRDVSSRMATMTRWASSTALRRRAGCCYRWAHDALPTTGSALLNAPVPRCLRPCPAGGGS